MPVEYWLKRTACRHLATIMSSNSKYGGKHGGHNIQMTVKSLPFWMHMHNLQMSTLTSDALGPVSVYAISHTISRKEHKKS